MQRRAITIQGTVQGVGFRPFVYGLARQLGLNGFVKNQLSGVRIEVEGQADHLDQFLSQLTLHPPPLAQIRDVQWEVRPARGDTGFRIESSSPGRVGSVVIAPDMGTCDDCLREMFDPRDRRYHYPFLNCTNCGPRLTIVTAAPYDRQRTTMADFPMCPACRSEYEDPANRRFHAQPTACPTCGPRLTLCDAEGHQVQTDHPLGKFVAALQAGKIGAMKGLGGYHLVCDAGNAHAVAELCRRKHREEKPFAVMVKDLTAVHSICHVEKLEQQLLQSNRRPIVLLRKKSTSRVADSVAPGNPYLGVMLPYTPLHHLLFSVLNSQSSVLVMTSGNRSDEPIAHEEPEVFDRLRGIADLYLVHNRPIHVRCDDSVTRVMEGSEAPVRRSRGYAPQPIRLPMRCPQPILAVGGQLKGTFALGRDLEAVVGHHLGDLDHYEACKAFETDIALYEDLFAHRTHLIAHDLHPDYASTRYARKRGQSGLPCIAVQHHHAHMASCMAENGLNEPVIGISLDGTGYGTDGAIWGGEFLVGDYSQFWRGAHLRYVGLAGGDQAIREPWRMALSHLIDANCDCPSLNNRIAPDALRMIRQMIQRRFNTPLTSSAGRLFDAVAALAGVRDRVSFEGQAAMQLEWLATNIPPCGMYDFPIQEESVNGKPSWVIDTRPLIRGIAADVQKGIDTSAIARRFHSTLVQAILDVSRHLRAASGLQAVVLSGGVFMNALLTTEVYRRLTEAGFRVYRHRLVPANDGGLSLGQIAVAACSADQGASHVSRNSR